MLAMMPMTSAPSSVLMTPPRPPMRLAPPMTTAAMTLSSAPMPTCAEPTPVRLDEMMPATAASAPEMT